MAATSLYAFGGDGAFLNAQVEKASITMLLRLACRWMSTRRWCASRRSFSRKNAAASRPSIYFEARGESTEGQLAVARVILNRVGSEHYPDSICGVVYQGASRATGCQFSFTCDKRVNKVPNERRAWAKARRTAEYVTLGRIGETELAPAMFYHADYVQPYWAASMVEVAKIGRHSSTSRAAKAARKRPSLRS